MFLVHWDDDVLIFDSNIFILKTFICHITVVAFIILFCVMSNDKWLNPHEIKTYNMYLLCIEEKHNLIISIKKHTYVETPQMNSTSK